MDGQSSGDGAALLAVGVSWVVGTDRGLVGPEEKALVRQERKAESAVGQSFANH